MQFAEKVKEGERLKGERKRWIKDQLEWKKTREAMQEKIEFLVKRSNTQTQRADAAEAKMAAAEAKAIRLEQELFGANAKILEEQQERLTMMRAKASSAAHAASQQSKQFDRGKNVCARKAV
jgi:hypothetical protein